MKRLLQIVESVGLPTKFAGEKRGQKPGDQWRGTDKNPPGNKLVGGAEESIIKDLNKTAKKKVTEWQIKEAFRRFKEDETTDGDSTLKVYDPKNGGSTFTEPNKPATVNPSAPKYAGVDPIVRQRMGMPAASQDEIRNYLDQNPPTVRTGTGDTVRNRSGQAVTSAGAASVIRAADAVSPDRAQAVAREPAQIVPRPNNIQPATITKPITTTTTATEPEVKIEPRPSNVQPVAPAVKPVVPKIPTNPEPGSWQDLYKQNQGIIGNNPNLIKPGQVLKIPNDPEGASYTVQKGDTLDKINKSVGGLLPQPKAQPSTAVQTKPSAASTNATTVSAKAPSPADQLKTASNSLAVTMRKQGKTEAEIAQELGKLYNQQMTKESMASKFAKEFEMFIESDVKKDTVAKTWKELSGEEKLSGVKGRTVWNPATRKYVVVFDVPRREKQTEEYGNATDTAQQATNPNVQSTNPASAENPEIRDQQIDLATAKGTTTGLKSVLGPKVDTNAMASGIAKMNDAKPLTQPEQTAISTLTPLVAKAAETPAVAGQLKSALQTAGVQAKLGK